MASQPGFWKELFQFAKAEKRWWLIPIIAVLMVVALLVALTTSSVIAPFIYTLF